MAELDMHILSARSAAGSSVFGKLRGYSLMEDLALSLTVGRSWTLANARTARIYHDSQPGDHKRSVVTISEMELVNRYFVMTQIMGQRNLRDYGKLALWELFQLAVCALQAGPCNWSRAAWKILGLYSIVAKKTAFHHR